MHQEHGIIAVEVDSDDEHGLAEDIRLGLLARYVYICTHMYTYLYICTHIRIPMYARIVVPLVVHVIAHALCAVNRFGSFRKIKVD